MEKIDLEILRLMEHGGIEKCDREIKAWFSGEYSKDQTEIQKMVQEWKRKRELA